MLNRFIVNRSLTVKRLYNLAAARRRNGGLDKGRRLIRLSAIGLPPGMPASARSEPPRGFPCQIRRGPGRLELNRGPHPYLAVSRQPTGVLCRRCGSVSESDGLGAVLAARAARRAALKPYRKLTDGGYWGGYWAYQLGSVIGLGSVAERFELAEVVLCTGLGRVSLGQQVGEVTAGHEQRGQ
jgi:hypothetical protein